ncbi:Putative alcohol dehydrogenase, zinc-type, GroES-like superfamily, NAD(P)-binding domain superfamily [Septoria linicola]|uniref:Alcohol dehydrogenase, zinc-type, GroES-like superfamily, NAD(P)-binding domain superfamily n=1 Tax=Septoria linicola TaxID=215465 RepID=A0A9Q9ANT1_9PEZI|nr:Putative alcohol dehydrogenase, zinc-type, GroES-like superfamily, NAD(P)-binding domain superfamily [Septoria linicola]
MAAVQSSKAIVSHDTLDNKGWKMEEVTLRDLQEGELLVEMVATGVCHTDALIGGIPAGAAPIAFYPRVLGHEGSGYVRKVGPDVSVAAEGDPVLLSFAFCDKCEICKTGGHSNCNLFNELNFGPQPAFHLASKSGEPEVGGCFFGQSSFANFSIVKSCSVVNVKGIVTEKRDLQLFSPLGCGIQTGSGTVVNVSGAGPKDAICIMGLGGVGLSAIMGAKIQGCRTIIGIDKVDSRLKLAKELGATHVIDGSKLDEGKTLPDVVKEIADGVGPTITIDTTGAPVLMDAGMQFTRNRGKYIQVGSPPFDYTLGSVSGFEFMVAGKQWIGAIEGGAYPPEYVPKMIQWYREGRFPIDKLMKLMPADDFNQALHEMHTGETIKPILTWS